MLSKSILIVVTVVLYWYSTFRYIINENDQVKIIVTELIYV
jgi:hypothetical protein